MTTEIKQLSLEESIKILHFLSSYAFTPSPPLPEFEQYAEKIRSRKGAKYFAVFEDKQPQAISCATTPLNQNLRGKLFKMGGVANIASHPAARRKGYVSQLMDCLFHEFYKYEYAVSCLYPFKEVFYERFGYVSLPQTKKITFNPLCLLPTLKINIKCNYELVSFEEGYSDFRSFLIKYQQNTHGMALFSKPLPQAAKHHKAWLLLAKEKSEIIAAINYNLHDQMLNQTFNAFDFLYLNPTGKYLLLNWIARHIDQATKVILTLKPDQFGENLYTDIRPTYHGLFVAPMARVVNVQALSGLPIKGGEISVRISDTYCDWNNGIWHLSNNNGKLQIKKGEKPECDLSIHGLTALVYGVYDPEEFILRGWGNPNSEQQETLRNMFPPAIPYLHAMY